MKKDWLWDRKLGIAEAKKILGNPQHKEFIYIAALLFARKNEPEVVFKEYIKPLLFCRYWPKIKKQMRRDKWNEQRIIFWQAIYEKLLEKCQKKGIRFRKETKAVRDNLCREIGEEIRRIRKEKGLFQKELAEKLKVSQQLVSRIERGKENVSLITLKNIARVLDRKIKINFCQSLNEM